MEKITRFRVPDTMHWEQVYSRLKEAFSIRQENSFNKEITFFDTFDWRVYRGELMLVKENNLFDLRRLEDEASVVAVDWPQRVLPKFYWDFPEGEYRARLGSLINVRALSPLASVKKRTQNFHILNDDEKTVLRLIIESNAYSDKERTTPQDQLVKLKPVRGYRQEWKKIVRFLSESGLEPEKRSEFEIALHALGRKPGDYSSKLRIHLVPSQSASEAVTTILLTLLQTIRRNEEGVKEDIDTEFLHDFRVAIRRTRSAITQLKGVLPRDIQRKFKGEFSRLAKLTNRLRDLDVYLLKKSSYEALVPEPLRTGLQPFFHSLHRERGQEHKKLLQYMNSESYRQLLAGWDSVLNNLGSSGGKNAGTPILELAQRFISRQYDRMIKLGETIDPIAPDEQLHRLRIECKKLRYLLEFFAALFPADRMGPLIKQFKELQDTLGLFNDLGVQQQYLNQYLTTGFKKGEGSWRISAAVGGLIAVLYYQQVQARKAFHHAFQWFHSRENQAKFTQLFHKPMSTG